MENIAVSIIIPVYNCEKHLEECLDSCINQTLKNMEIICINDGSTDGTAHILESYQKDNKNIIVIHQTNQGSGFARNAGLDVARGEFIAFMDSDDFYPDKGVLKLLYTMACQHSVNVCGGSYHSKINNGIEPYQFTGRKEKNRFFSEGKVLYRDYQFAYGYTRFIYRKKMLQDNRIRFPSYRRFQDPPFMVKAMVCAKKFYAVKEETYVCRNTDKVIYYSDDEIIEGIMKGISDILKISKSENLAELHADMVSLLNSYIGYAYKSIFKGNLHLIKVLEESICEIDAKMLKEYKKKCSIPCVKSLDEIRIFMSDIRAKGEKLKSLVDNYKHILIYGAGQAGRMLCSYLLQSGCQGSIEFAVTAERPTGTACGRNIKCISEYVKYADKTLVLVANRDSAEEMVAYARKLGFANIELVNYKDLILLGEK